MYLDHGTSAIKATELGKFFGGKVEVVFKIDFHENTMIK